MQRNQENKSKGLQFMKKKWKYDANFKRLNSIRMRLYLWIQTNKDKCNQILQYWIMSGHMKIRKNLSTMSRPKELQQMTRDRCCRFVDKHSTIGPTVCHWHLRFPFQLFDMRITRDFPSCVRKSFLIIIGLHQQCTYILDSWIFPKKLQGILQKKKKKKNRV